MGRRGPAPTPTATLRRRGSWRADARGDEPEVEAGRPDCPAWLGTAERLVWESLLPRLEAMGILTLADRNALARYCRMLVRWQAAEAFLADKGETYVLRDSEGVVKCMLPVPQVAIARALADQLLKLEAQFGLTPSARAALGMHTRRRSGEKAPTHKRKTKDRFFVD